MTPPLEKRPSRPCCYSRGSKTFQRFPRLRVAARRVGARIAGQFQKDCNIGARVGHKEVFCVAEEKRPNYERRKGYRELRQSMLQNLIDRDLDGDVYRDKVQEYMDFWVRRQELRDDIARRGLTVTDDRGRLMENRSVSLEIQVSRQMLAIFTTLGFKEDALAAAARGDDDDEL